KVGGPIASIPELWESLSRSVLPDQTGKPLQSYAGDQTALFRVRNQLGSPSDKAAIADFELVGFGPRHDLDCHRAVVANSLRTLRIRRQRRVLQLGSDHVNK